MFSAKKLLVIGFVAILLIAIPVTMFVLQQQQEIRSQAAAATTLSFAPPSTPSSPYQVQVGEMVNLDVMVNPNSNSVSFVRLEIQYDPTKLAPPDNIAELFEQNKTAFSVTNQPPVSTEGKLVVSVSVPAEEGTANNITTSTKVGTVHLKALELTDTPTQVLYGLQSQVLSEGTNEQASENVLTDKSPAVIAIVASSITPSTTISPSPNLTPSPSVSPEPTITTTPEPTGTESANIIPVCSLLTADVASGSAPLTVNFTATGTDSDGTINKATFNLGDGTVTSVTDNLGTASVSALLAHTYQNGGTFTASAVMTDNLGGASADSCPQTIVVAGPTATPSAGLTEIPTPTTALVLDTPTPTIESPGPGAALIGVGAFFTFLSVIGAVLFFAL